MFSTDLADWLVIKGVPFREAHNIVGEIVKYCEAKNMKFGSLTLTELKRINPVFNKQTREIFDIKNVLSRKKTLGSPNPDLVKLEIEKWINKIKKEL